MVRDDNREHIENESLIKLGDDQQNRSSLQSQTVQRSDLDKNIMETEVRDYFDFYRNSSEEIFLKTLMESTIGMPATTMEMLGFKNLSQSFRADSEELFNSWLMNGEVPGYSSTSIAHRTRQASRRISSELSSLSNQQHGVTFQRKDSNDKIFPQNISNVDELSSDPNQHSLRNAVEKGMQASNLYLAKAWFHSSQPMTRSRSSELRRRYAAMQSLQTPPSLEVTHNSSGRGVSRMKQDFVPTNNIHHVPISEMSNQLSTFMSPSNSSTSNFNSQPMASVDAVSSVVSMLKGALESKKFSNQIDEKAVEGNSCGFYDAHGIAINTSNDQGPGNHVVELPATFQAVSSMQLKESGALQEVEGSIHFNIEGLVTTSNPVQMRAVSQEPSQSESSAAAPVLSTGFDICDGPTYSSPIPSTCETSRGKFGNRSSEHGFKAKELRERIYDNNLKDERKKGSLVRMESITSDGQVDKGDPSKKRRVERSRKMAEAKERNLTPAVPSDMQSILKRCENLEKEVRSLKLNLSFMNRKDSEQTKQIEELQKQNEELADEKERLLEEIERIISEPGNF